MGKEADITTLREEGEYLDGRHPSFIRFVTELLLHFAEKYAMMQKA